MMLTRITIMAEVKIVFVFFCATLLNKEVITDIFYRRETMGSERHRYIHRVNGMLGEFKHKFKKLKDIGEFREQIHRYLQFKKNMAARGRIPGEMNSENICD